MTLTHHLRRLTTRLRRQPALHTVLITNGHLPRDWPPTAVRTGLPTDDLRLVLLYLQFLEMDLLLDAGRGGGLFPSGFGELLRLHWGAEVEQAPVGTELSVIELSWNWEGRTLHPETGKPITLAELPTALQQRGLSRQGVGASVLALAPYHIDDDPEAEADAKVARAMLSPFAAEDTPEGWLQARAWVDAQMWPPAATWF